MISVSIDNGHWTNQMRKLASLMGKSIDEIVKGEAKLFVKDCLKATPPFTPGKNWTESFSAQRKVGNDAVLADAKRLFKPAGAFGKLSGDKPFAKRIAGLVRDGKDDEAVDALRADGINVRGIVKRAEPSVHMANRDKRGRVRKGAPFIVHDGRFPQDFDSSHRKRGELPDNTSIRRIVKQGQKMVGNAKSGWAKAAQALGVPVPAWIRKQRGSGAGIYKQDGTGFKFGVTVGNGVPYIQGTARELRIMKWAQANRMKNLEKRIATILRKRKVAK